MREGINPPGLETPRPAYSQVAVSGDLVWTSGQVGPDEDHTFVSADVGEQTRKALDNIRTALAAAGCTMNDVLKVTTILGDNSYFKAYDGVYREFFSAPYPARTTVAVEFDDETCWRSTSSPASRRPDAANPHDHNEYCRPPVRT